MKLTETQHQAVVSLIQEGVKAPGRWVDLKGPQRRTVRRLYELGVVEQKATSERTLFRVNAARLAPIKGVAPRISREIHRALLKGLNWTPWRPFHPGTSEWMGAARCGVRPRSRKCLKVATHVSYTVNLHDSIDGRVARCANCLPKEAAA